MQVLISYEISIIDLRYFHLKSTRLLHHNFIAVYQCASNVNLKPSTFFCITGLISNGPRVEASYVGLLINNYEQREVVPKIREDYLFSDLNTIVLSYSQRRRSCFYSEWRHNERWCQDRQIKDALLQLGNNYKCPKDKD